jgi:lipopolysaccharide biosynthesis glycosyltransferase
VCFAFTDIDGKDYQHAIAALSAIFDNTASPIKVHILYDSHLNTDTQKKITDLVHQRGHAVRFHAVPKIDDSTFTSIYSHSSIGTLYRLFIPQTVDEETVLYFDCDTICNLDIRDIFDAADPQAVISAVPDTGLRDTPTNAGRLRAMGLDPARYVNAGVMLMQCGRLREEYPDYTERTFGAMKAARLRYMDQDAINLFLQKRNVPLQLLPETFNFAVGVRDRAFLPRDEYRNKVLHFTGDKPWEALYPAALQYWKYHARCFPADETFARMEELTGHEYMYLYTFMLCAPKLRRWVNRCRDVAVQGFFDTLLDRLSPARRKRRHAERVEK